jgi:hypothetical protein
MFFCGSGDLPSVITAHKNPSSYKLSFRSVPLDLIDLYPNLAEVAYIAPGLIANFVIESVRRTVEVVCRLFAH